MEKLSVTVTSADIRNGVKASLCSCPVAKAVRRTTKSQKCKVVVDGFTATVGNKEYSLPRRVSRFVQRFDDGLPVKPFKFVARTM